MNLEILFVKLADFIKKHHWLLDSEVLSRYPSDIPEPYKTWIKDLSLNHPEKLISIENLCPFDSTVGEIKDFINEIKILSRIDKIELDTTIFEKKHLTYISQKKEHEIKQIKKLLEHKRFDNIYDFCSGKAHLSQILMLSRNEFFHAYDYDKSLQDSGKKVFNRYFKDNSNRKLNFINKDLLGELKFDLLPRSLLVGLHACGDLSTNIIQKVNKDDSILSIGCCYHKLESGLNLSSKAKELSLNLSFHSLSLANHSGRILTKETWLKRLKVKKYRYPLHMIDKDLELNLEKSAKVLHHEYDLPFKDYARKFIKEDLDFDALYDKYSNNDLIEKYYLIETLRNPVGRIIELFLILDRALYLKDQGHNVKIAELFDQKESPRNIAIFNF